MKIKDKRIRFALMAVLYVLGWVIVIAFGIKQRGFLVFPIMMWGWIVYALRREEKLGNRYDVIGRGLQVIIIPNIVFLLTAFTDHEVIITIAAIIMEFYGFCGIIIVANGLSERKGKRVSNKTPFSQKSNVKSAIVQKPRCEKCGKELGFNESKYCSKCKQEAEQCSECGLFFQRGDLHAVDGKYYCHGCFESKYINVHNMDEDQEAHIDEREIEESNEEKEEEKKVEKKVEKTTQIPCFTMIKNLFETNSEKEPEVDKLKALCDKNIFIIYTYATMQPLCYMDRLCAYDTREKAIGALDKYIVNNTFREYLYSQEIKPEELAEEVKKCLSSGFGSLVLNNEYLVPLSSLPVYDEAADYGIACPAACNLMLCYKERVLAFECDEEAAKRERSREDAEKQKALFEGVVRALGHSVLLLPEEEHRKKNIENKEVLMVFTDRFARNAYDSIPSVNMIEITLEELYYLAEEDESISGIVVNPGREDFRMRKRME